MAKNNNNQPQQGNMYKSFNELSPIEKQFYQALRTSHGQAMLNQFKVEHEQMKVSRTELQAKRQAEANKLLGNQTQANQQFIRNVGGVLSVVETGEAGEVKAMKALTQQMELDPNLQAQLQKVDPVGYSMKRDGVFTQEMNARMYYTNKAEFENQDMRYLDLNLEAASNHDDPTKQLALKEFMYNKSEAGQKEIKAKLSAYDTLISDYSVKLGEKPSYIPREDEVNLAKRLLDPNANKPFLGGNK